MKSTKCGYIRCRHKTFQPSLILWTSIIPPPHRILPRFWYNFPFSSFNPPANSILKFFSPAAIPPTRPKYFAWYISLILLLIAVFYSVKCYIFLIKLLSFYLSSRTRATLSTCQRPWHDRAASCCSCSWWEPGCYSSRCQSVLLIQNGMINKDSDSRVYTIYRILSNLLREKNSNFQLTFNVFIQFCLKEDINLNGLYTPKNFARGRGGRGLLS